MAKICIIFCCGLDCQNFSVVAWIKNVFCFGFIVYIYIYVCRYSIVTWIIKYVCYGLDCLNCSVMACIGNFAYSVVDWIVRPFYDDFDFQTFFVMAWIVYIVKHILLWVAL